MSAEEPRPFTLSANLSGHSQDVRGVAFPRKEIIFSCSRDSTARAWSTSLPHSATWKEVALFRDQGNGYVNCVAYLKEGTEEFLVSGGRDALINLWNLNTQSSQSPQPQFCLIGHEGNVCCLDVGGVDGQTIVSGSWDCTARLWRQHKLVRTLTGHKAAVWTVLLVGGSCTSQDEVLTGAADNLIKFWKGPEERLTFTGHTQPVRALTRIPTDPTIFASAGNDASVRIWSLSGDALHVFNGHDSFVYSLACLPSGELVSSGEDRSVRIWETSNANHRLTQTITVPAVSVWSVAVCRESGDIVCGSSDHRIRIFTRDRSRYADPATVAEFEESVRSSTLPSATVGDVKKSDLRGRDALNEPGKKEGQVIMVKNDLNDAVEAYQWDSAKGSWEMVGTVVDGVGSSRKQLFEGKEFDYVFDVDIKDGAPPLKLPYNVSDNPYVVAQQWLAKNELPDSYVDQVVAFLDKNTGGVQLGSNTAGDPYTGERAYRPGNRQEKPAGDGLNRDPWTDTTSKAPFAGPASTPHLPHLTVLSFERANLSSLRNKLSEFNQDAGTNSLSNSELEAIDELVQFLELPQGMPPARSAAALTDCISRWSPETLFPAYDLLRLRFLHEVTEASFDRLLDAALASSRVPCKMNETNGMLALRTLANGFASPTGKQIMKNWSGVVLEQVLKGAEKGQNKNGRIAFATLLLNYSTLESDLGTDDTTNLLRCVLKGIEDTDSEVVYRSLVAFGNITWTKKDTLPVDVIRQGHRLAENAVTRISEPRIKDVCSQFKQH